MTGSQRRCNGRLDRRRQNDQHTTISSQLDRDGEEIGGMPALR
jgi:hypothetical protein